MFGVGEMRGPSSAGHPVFVISGEEKMSDLSRIAAASLLVATVANRRNRLSAEVYGWRESQDPAHSWKAQLSQQHLLAE